MIEMFNLFYYVCLYLYIYTEEESGMHVEVNQGIFRRDKFCMLVSAMCRLVESLVIRVARSADTDWLVVGERAWREGDVRECDLHRTRQFYLLEDL